MFLTWKGGGRGGAAKAVTAKVNLRTVNQLREENEGAAVDPSKKASLKVSVKSFTHRFRASGAFFGFGFFLKRADLADASVGFLVDDAIVFEADVSVQKVEGGAPEAGPVEKASES